MKFISLCSGIEAASVAFNPLGWEAICFAEIEPFPSALLQERFPHVPNMGDMTRYEEWPEEFFSEADMIVGGPPCQSFSVAGKRGGLDDDRGNLTLIFTELIDHADAIRLKHGKPPVIILYENVPGLLSDKTNAFGCLLGALAGEDDQLNPSGQRWTNAGAVLGPERSIAWRILDAQYFGLAQRRKRVFVIASARAGFSPSEILFEYDGVRRDIAPSRETGQAAAGDAGAGFTPSSFGGYREGVGTLRAAGGDLGGGSETLVAGAGAKNTGFRKLTFESYTQDETASTMMARDHKSYTDLVAYGTPGNWIGRKPENGGNSTQFMHEIAPKQTATDRHGVIAINNCLNPEQPQCWRVYDPHGVAPALQSGEARGNIVAFAQNSRDEVRYLGGDGQIAGTLAANPGMKQTTYIAFNSRQDPVSGEVFGALDTGSPQAQAVAYGCTPTKLNAVANTITASYGQGGVDLETKPLALVTTIAGTQNDAFRDATDNLAPTLRSGSGGGVINQAVATVYPINTMTMLGRPSDDLKPRMGLGIGKENDPQNTLSAAHCHAVATQTAVRRLTPIECERLQGFPDNWTAIPWRNKPASECPDGHRYKALGNSWAVPVVYWIGKRIANFLNDTEITW